MLFEVEANISQLKWKHFNEAHRGRSTSWNLPTKQAEVLRALFRSFIGSECRLTALFQSAGPYVVLCLLTIEPLAPQIIPCYYFPHVLRLNLIDRLVFAYNNTSLVSHVGERNKILPGTIVELFSTPTCHPC